jgi:hypothetical protein
MAGWFNRRRFVAESRPRTPTTDRLTPRRRAKMLLSVNQISNLTGRDRHGIPKRLESLPFTPGDKGAPLYESCEALPLIYAVDNLEAARAAQARSQASSNAVPEEDLRDQTQPQPKLETSLGSRSRARLE